jgi:ectoine hydroxylase-related dioxygenase (phytanoyl-CoA dioxygenase family)
MPFSVSDQHIVEFHSRGYTILRSVLTPGLLRELRPAAEQCRQIARRKTEMHGEQVLRPLGNYTPEVDLAPFRNYAEHPPFINAIHRIVDPDAQVLAEDVGILFEPSTEPMCTNWHRDISPPVKEWDAFRRRVTMANASFNASINCALYADSCIGYVPGSHSRPLTESEERVIASWKDFDAVERDGDPLVMDPVEKEAACIETFRAMPNAVQFTLEAGDAVIYASYGLHFAHRAPYRLRATLHHHPRSEIREDWIREHVVQ